MILNWRGVPVWAVVFLYLFSSLNAQDKINLSLNEALELAKTEGYDLRLARAEVDAMRGDKNKSLSVFLPQVTLSETYIKTTDPLNVFGLKLKQEIVSQADFNPVLLNDPAEFENFNTKLEVKQPIINIDGFFGKAAAADGLAAMKHKSKRTEQYVEFMVKMNYYQLILQNKNLNVIEKSLQTAKANRKLIKDYYDEGLVTKADYLMAEVYVSNLESQKVEAENSVKKANDNLKLLIGLEDAGDVNPTDALSLPAVQEINYELKSSIANRSDIQSYSYRVSSLKNMNRMNWAKLLPRFNAFGSYEFNDSKVFGTNAKNWMVGLNLQWNVFNGYQNIGLIQKSEAELRLAEVEYQKAKLKGENEINESIRDLETAKTKLTLAEAAVNQTEESLRIISDRYGKGLEKTTDLLNAETAASKAKLNYLKSLFFYNVSLFKIELMLEQKFVNK